MSASLTFHPYAERELTEAARYYGRENQALALAFLDEIRRCVQVVCENPKAPSLVGGDVRRQLARRFPYAILFTESPKELRILAIAHLKRRPFYWAGRT